MIEKVKSFFTTMASTAVLLYTVGYMAEYSHSRMLGVSLVDPFREYYLISGGTFILSTLYALYSTIFSYFLTLVPFVLIIAAILLYEPAAPKTRGSKIYAALVFIVTLFFLFVAVPIFSSPFAFKDLLLVDVQANPGFLFKQFNYITSELRTWILNGGLLNKQKLALFYMLSILSTVVAAVMLYSMVRRWKQWKIEEPDLPPINSVSWPRYMVTRLLKFMPSLPKRLFGLLIIMVMIIVVVQVITIPVNYGILIKSNEYPVVKVVVQREGYKLLENIDNTKESKLWLLSENNEKLLLYTVFYTKNSEDIHYKLLTLNKILVEKVEIIDNSFIFKYK